MKHIFLCALLALFGVLAHAQQVKGTVYDAANHNVLAGATIKYQGKGGASTDKDGNFSIDCNTVSSIRVSYVGYQSVSVSIKNCDQPLIIELVPSSQYLNEIEISATSNQNKSILYHPASISKLSPVELKRETGLYLDDAINTNIPGVSMNRRTVSGGQQINIRGYGNGTRGTRGISSNFDGQGYKVYLNGIPVTDAEGITTFDDLDMASIGDVEVTKGPAGTLYGLAIAGAMNLKTIKPQKGKTSLGQEVTIGNYGMRRSTTQFQSGGERAQLLANYGHQNSDGFSIHNKSKKDFVNFVGDFQPKENQSINTYVGFSNSYDERFGELTVEQFDNNDYSGNPEYIKRNAHSNVITFRAGISHSYSFNKSVSNTTTLFGTGFTSNASSAGGWTDKNTINYGFRSVFNTRFSLGDGASLSGITGLEMQRQDGQVVGYNMKQDPSDTGSTWVYGESPYWVINAITSDVTTISKTSSLFTDWTLGLAHDVTISAGVGISNMKITLNDRFNPELTTRPAQYNKKYDGMVSPHVAINKVFNKQFSIYAAYSKAYKAPVSSYFYITTPAVTSPPTPLTGRVNEELEPEIGTQFEIGTKGQLLNNRFIYELAYFYAKFKNKMTAVAVPSPSAPNTTLYSYVVNGGEQDHQGVEGLVRFILKQSNAGFFKLVRPFANLTYSDFKYGDNFTIEKSPVVTEDYSNKDVAAVPKFVANLGLDLLMNYGLYANIVYNHKEKMPITSVNDLYAIGYNLLNGKIGMQRNLGKHFDLDVYCGATNITNSKYYIMVFANQLPDAYIPAAKNANVYGGANLKYTF